MQNVAGIQQTDAQKSSDMFMKCRYLDEMTGGRGIVFATGTPVSNSMVELYTIMRYLQYDRLQAMGLEHFDAWAASFGDTVTAIELAPEGTGYRAKTRFARFYNLPELISMFKECADIRTADMLNLPVPKAEFINEVLKPSEIQQDIRLTYLVPELLRLVDEGRVAFTPAVNLSYLTEEEQGWVLDEMVKNDCTPSNGQAILLKQKSLDDTLTKDFAAGLLCQEKANQRETLRIAMDRLNDLLPAGTTPRQKEDYIVKACTFYRNHLKRMREETR